MDGWVRIQEDRVMADYNAFAAAGPDPNNRAYIPDQATGIHNRVYAQTVQGALIPTVRDNAAQLEILDPAENVNDYSAFEDFSPTQHFFEMCHHIPDIIELGNILSTVTQQIEIYNAFRRDAKEFTSATEDAGPGVSFIGLPSLPAVMPMQTGIVFEVQVTTVGPPRIDGTLDFVTTCGNFSIVITGDRVVMFSFAPERGISETLEFRTDIITAANGGEQRISIRKNPRQFFTMNLRIEEGKELRDMQALLQGWHPGVFGVPIWWEARELINNGVSGSQVIAVDTAYGDFRVGGLAIVWISENEFDALQIQTIVPGALVFTSALTRDYSRDETLVMPLRTGYLTPQINANRYIKNLMDVQLRVQVIDNDVGSIEDTSAFSSHNSKVLLDDPNIVSGSSVDDGLVRDLIRIDSDASNPIQFSTWLASHPTTSKAFFADSMQEVWQVRQLVHALRGSQIAFYLPTFYQDLIAVQDLAASSDLLDIESIKYVDYIQGREPFKSLWIELNDGTVLTREIIAYDTISDTVERLTVDSVWPSLIDKDDIARISFCRLVRIANDEVRFEHDRPGQARILTDVVGVETP